MLFLKIENLSFFWILLLYSSINSIKLIILGDKSLSLLDEDLNVFPINTSPLVDVEYLTFDFPLYKFL